jgi:spoIIIJ-associated protein
VEESITYAKKYLEDMLSFFGLNTDVHATSEEDVIELSVPSTHMNGFLIGQRGETMRALQFMVSNALKNNEYEFTRVNVDIADYKKHRADQVAEQAEHWVNKVKTSGEPLSLKPMNPADRRIVHKVAADHGLETTSEGFGRDRHVVIKPSASNSEDSESVKEPAKESDEEK